MKLSALLYRQAQIIVKPDTTNHSGPVRKITYKVDTGADGILLLLRKLRRVQPGIDKNELAHMITLMWSPEVYKGTEIEKCGQVSPYLSYQLQTKKCRFYMVARLQHCRCSWQHVSDLITINVDAIGELSAQNDDHDMI